MTDELSPRLDEREVRAVLARAIEIDAQSPTTSIAELRSIAVELGVSPAAVDAALREQISARRELKGHPRAATAVAASGLVLGAAAGMALATIPLFNLGLIGGGLTAVGLVASGAILVLQGPAVTLRSFGTRNLALWAGYAAGGLAAIAVLGGSPELEMSWLIPLSAAVRNFLSTTILGSAAVLAVRQALPRRDHETGSTSPGILRRAAAAVSRVAGALRSWKPTEMRGLRHWRVWHAG